MSTLSPRPGTRPETSIQIPHRQNDQQPADRAQLDALLGEAATWPGVRTGESGVSVEGAWALHLEDDLPAGPAEAFMVDREFCHGHAQGDYSLHACLPLDLAAEAERAGWAEPHFLVRTGQLPATVVMLFAPRDDAERAVVLRLVRASYDFARTPLPEGDLS